MNKSAFFISDIHLGTNPEWTIPDREAHLCNFIDSLHGKASHLILVGDIFEFWMEYNDFIPKKQFRFLNSLANLRKSGVEMHYMAGNHDFNLGTFFQDELDIPTHPDSVTLTIQNKKVFFIHGDGLSASDWKYRIVKKIITAPFSNFLFKILHPDWGMALARSVGHGSRKAGYSKDVPFKEYDDAVRSILIKEECDILVHGHTHHGHVKDFEEGIYVNSGHWMNPMNYIEMRDGICTLKNYEPDKSGF